MHKYKELGKNIGVLALSNFGSKILTFLLVPIYTAVLSTAEYGDFDIVYTTISLLVPILTLNITEGALRFLLDKKDTDSIFSICLKRILISFIAIAMLLIINNQFNIIPIIKGYWKFFIAYYIVFTAYQSLQNLTRGLDRLRSIGISGIINSAIMLSLSIIFLVVFRLGINGYFLANIIASLTASIYLAFKIHFFSHIRLKQKNEKLERDLVKYSKPMMLNSISWWIDSVSDRFIVTLLCGAAANGIYSIAYKIPSILSIIQSIFNQAWTISSAKTFNKNDEDNYFQNIYKLYNLLLILCCSIMIICSKVLAKILYMNSFYEAWQYMPFLMISVIFSSLAGVLSGIFVAIKNSKAIGATAFAGAITNIILNIALVLLMGPLGAAISTMVSNIIIWAARYLYAKKYIKLKINILQDILSYIILIIQAIALLTITAPLALYSIELTLCIIIVSIKMQDILKIVYKLRNKRIKK